jgi:hypothetical protein
MITVERKEQVGGQMWVTKDRATCVDLSAELRCRDVSADGDMSAVTSAVHPIHRLRQRQHDAQPRMGRHSALGGPCCGGAEFSSPGLAGAARRRPAGGGHNAALAVARVHRDGFKQKVQA